MEILCGKNKSVIKTGKTELECCKEGREGEAVFGRKTLYSGYSVSADACLISRHTLTLELVVLAI